MTRGQATTEAVLRWGKDARAHEEPSGMKCVGTRLGLTSMTIHGRGETWADAFFDAESREDADRKVSK